MLLALMGTPMEGLMARSLGRSLAGACVLVASPSLAHEWYPVSCCSDRDCHPLVEANGETVTESADGWRLWDGRIIARNRARPSPDRQFHLCETPAKTIICFFAPPGSS
jgi:hypothetical protein